MEIPESESHGAVDRDAYEWEDDFSCPNCKGRDFDTEDTDAEIWVRICADEYGTGCTWRGNRLNYIADLYEKYVRPTLSKEGA